MGGGESLFSSGAGTLAVVALVLSLLALGGMVFMLARQQRVLGQYQHLMMGTSGGNLEEMLNEHIAHVRDTTAQVAELDDLAHRLERAATYSLQHLGMVRYNPFHDVGGDQSFAIALADDHGNGVVLSSLHTRSGTRVYAKPLYSWESSHSLTDEEKQAIDLASQERS